jgi:hypothetical protein
VLQPALAGLLIRNKTFLAAYHLMRVNMNWIDRALAVLMIVPTAAGPRAGLALTVVGLAARLGGARESVRGADLDEPHDWHVRRRAVWMRPAD